MKLFSVRYWWHDRTGEHSGSTVTTGITAEDALAHFKLQNPHLSNAAIITIG